MGGYRQGSGRSKTGYYKGIYCGSTYELCWVIYAIENNIGFSRFPGCLDDGTLKYYPDFLLSDGKTIVETKGYEAEESVQRKTKLAEKFGYTVNVLRKTDLKFAFDYVSSKYTKKFHTLYDGYKPKYEYTCGYCEVTFQRDAKLRNGVEIAFCSRSCSCKFNRSKLTYTNKVKDTKNMKRKFTKDEALIIFNDNSAGLTELAKKYGITKKALWEIKTSKSYKWIHSP